MKLVLVTAHLLRAAFNRLRLTPAIARGEAGAVAKLRRSVVAEIVLGPVVLGLASGCRLTPPPRAIRAAPVELHMHLHGGTVMGDVLPRPGRAGANMVEIGLQGGDAGLCRSNMEMFIAPTGLRSEAMKRLSAEGSHLQYSEGTVA